ncbi:MAG: sugar transferase [Tannerella sp.]|jgi:exopolysaccharide biosynthesis polyprenyl glycosylphosphotransferase|nr:sugar transferase [Tannerella sp.]
MNRRRQIIKYILTDFLTASVTWALFNVLRFHEVAQYNYPSPGSFLLSFQVLRGQILIPAAWIVLYFFSGYYNKPFGKSRIGEFFSTFVTVATGSVVIFFAVLLNELPRSFHIYYELFFALSAMQFVLTYTGRALITNHAIGKARKREWLEKVIVVGTGENARRAKDDLYRLGYRVLGFVRVDAGCETAAVNADEILGTTDDLVNILAEYPGDGLVVAIDGGDKSRTIRLLYSLYHYEKPVRIMAGMNDLLFGAKVKSIHGIPLIDVTENNFSELERNIKWLMDKVVALCVLTVLSPLYACISVRVRMDSKGPVFFRQERIGYRGKPFTIYKFRTMYADSAQQGPLLTARDDRRVTPFGRFLRKYRLDEIPQFWNVLRGDMSLVGPRPEQRYFIDRIVQKAPYYYLLHNVRPGITSWGMVKYGYAETVDRMIERLDYDILYYENMSLVLDLTILTYTVKIVFTGKGV